MTQRVRDFMTKHPVTVGPLTSLTETARRMRDENVGDALVVEDGRLCGIITDRDLVVRAMADQKDPDETTVHAICTTEVISINPGDSPEDALGLMRRHALRRLPVTEDDRPVGVVTLGDLAIEREWMSALADISAAEPST